MEQRPWSFHSQLGAQPAWGYWSGATGIGYLGPTIVAQQGRPVMVRYINNLPATHLLHDSIDTSLHSMDGLSATSRAVPHLHGGFTEPQSDGHPDAWFTSDPDGETGMDYHTHPLPDGTLPQHNVAVFRYSNAQPACLLWYHDHAMGLTRLNAYAGLAAAYIIRDAVDTGVVGSGLNLPKGPYEVPLVIQDKLFNPDGSMFYPTTSGVPAPYPHPIWVPEFFGDTPVVNGKAYPYLAVEPRRYRLRLVNGSQARFYNLWFGGKGTALTFSLIGMEQSLVPGKPVGLKQLVLAPGERADLIVDFSSVPFGTAVTLMNNARAPYPNGKGRPIKQIMQFQVTLPLTSKDTTTPPGKLTFPAILRLAPTAPSREIVMQETMDPVTGVPTDVRLNGKWFSEPLGPTDELPKEGDTEIWEFVNLTVDAHPMHIHLVQFQVYDRQPFDAAGYMAAWDAWHAGGTKPMLANFLAGAPVAPPAEERGWKDTVKALPGQITRVIARFDVPPGSEPEAYHGQIGYDYVYHCHILEHEENDMMRPFLVIPK